MLDFIEGFYFELTFHLSSKQNYFDDETKDLGEDFKSLQLVSYPFILFCVTIKCV